MTEDPELPMDGWYSYRITGPWSHIGWAMLGLCVAGLVIWGMYK